MRLSIVVAAWNGPRSLERCLASLGDEARAPDTEVIAATNFDGGVGTLLHARFPHVRHVATPRGTTVPVLRTAGIRCAAGEIVALTEDHCTFDPRWCEEIKKAHNLPYAAIGGPVENAGGASALDWAVYFYDYGTFMLPGRAGIVKSLSGANVSYKRAVLEQVESGFRDGFFESFTHVDIARLGYPLYFVPSAIVYHHKSYRLGTAVTQCYHLSRGYAAKRVSNAPAVRRGAFVAASILLPLVLLERVVVRTVRKGSHVREMVRSLPYLSLLLSCWSWGEFCGYIAGAGRSLGEWR